MKAFIACFAALLLASCAHAPAPAEPPVPVLAVPPGWRLVWADEFEQPGLPDPARWEHETGRNKEGWYNREQQYYSGPRAENAVVRDGKLVITARREQRSDQADWGGQAYTAARLVTRGRAAWTYGFFDVRAKLPCGKGTWPAIWTVGQGGRWPQDGELDIMEHVGQSPRHTSSAVHTAAGSGGDAIFGRRLLPSACDRFHHYQMLWTREGVWFGVDGQVHLAYLRTAVPGAWPFDAPQFMILNLAIGGDLGGPVDDRIFPVAMEIDHVRVYQAPADARR